MKSLNRRDFCKAVGQGLAAVTLGNFVSRAGYAANTAKKRKPNFIIFFTDDQGYNDVGCFGSPLIKTPRFDKMAREGTKFTSFYAQPVCGPSRAALMTGCYPMRIGEPENRKNQHNVLHQKEITIAEILKNAGYSTALIGKWHLGGNYKPKGYDPARMPNNHGFDYSYGTPVHHGIYRVINKGRFRIQLLRNNDIITDALDQEGLDNLTKDYTKEAVEFIHQNKDKPFFLYLSPNMPHIPLGASKEFRGKSKRGLYGDAVEELDWSIGKVLDTVKQLGLDEDTFIIYCSDNGPWINEKVIGDHGGSADPLRGGKMSAWEGGSRVPCIMRWPGKIPAGRVSDAMLTTMDILPTFTSLANGKLPDDRIIDGKDISRLITGASDKTPHEAFYTYNFVRLDSMRSGKWKLVLPRPANPPGSGWSGTAIDAVPGTQLFDLDADIGETHDVAKEHPDVVKRLIKLIEKAREDLGDYNRIGKGARFFDEGPRRSESKEWIDAAKVKL